MMEIYLSYLIITSLLLLVLNKEFSYWKGNYSNSIRRVTLSTRFPHGRLNVLFLRTSYKCCRRNKKQDRI